MDEALVNDLGEYLYKDAPLTPGLFGLVARALIAGETLSKAEIVKRVVVHHLDNGGKPGTQADELTAKKALSTLKKDGVITQVTHGIYRFPGSAGADELTDEELDEIEESNEVEDEENAPTEPPADWIYVYDLPLYAKDAEREGRSRWQHKIGLTTKTPDARVAQQASTALPERARIVLTHQCVDANLLEDALHIILHMRGHRVPDAPGTEWFFTNPDEVQSLINFIRGLSNEPSDPEPGVWQSMQFCVDSTESPLAMLRIRSAPDAPPDEFRNAVVETWEAGTNTWKVAEEILPDERRGKHVTITSLVRNYADRWDVIDQTQVEEFKQRIRESGLEQLAH